MAPLIHHFHFLLFLLFLFVPLLSTYTNAQQLSSTHTHALPLPRRILLSKSFDDVDQHQDLILPSNKKKASVDKHDSSLLKNNNKNIISSSIDVGESKKNKKYHQLKESFTNKNKSTLDNHDGDDKELKSMPNNNNNNNKVSFDNDDDDEKVSKSLLKKKKSTSSKDNDDDEIETIKVVKPKISSHKNQTKPIKPKNSSESNSSTKTQTKLNNPIIDSASSKNKTKLTKPTATTSTSSSKSKQLDIDSNNKSKIKKSNSTKKSSTPDLLKTTSNTKTNKTKSDTPKKPITNTQVVTKSKSKSETTKKQEQKKPPSNWLYQDDEDGDLIQDFRELPTKFQQTFVPDMQRISATSRVYLSKASKEITKGFKPYIGTKYAATITTAISFAFVLVPLLLVSLVFNHIKAYFNLQRVLIFIQIYLAIYFSILCVSSLITGLEPLRFFYATSRSTYIWLQLLQTLGYAMFLLLLLMFLVLVFSTHESGLGLKVLGLAQTFVGFAIGLHYYMTVFHRVVLRQPPKTNWKVHGIYATCFVIIICLFARMDRRKKAYLEEGGQQGKLN